MTAAKAKVAQLEAAIAAELTSELATLPARYGIETTKAFLTAVKAASGIRRGRVPATMKSAGRRLRKRAKITDATRAEVKKLVEAGKTGREIAKTVGISLPSVQDIKKAAGLVGKKGKQRLTLP